MGLSTANIIYNAGKPGVVDYGKKKRQMLVNTIMISTILSNIKHQQEVLRLYLEDCQKQLANLMAYRAELANSSIPPSPKDSERLDTSIKNIQKDIDVANQLLDASAVTTAGLELFMNATTPLQRALAVIAINVDKAQPAANNTFIQSIKASQAPGFTPAKKAKVLAAVTTSLQKQPPMVKVVSIVQSSQQQYAANNVPQAGPSAPKLTPGQLKKRDLKIQQVYVNKRAMTMELALFTALRDAGFGLRQARLITRDAGIITSINDFQGDMHRFVEQSELLEQELVQQIQQGNVSGLNEVGNHQVPLIQKNLNRNLSQAKVTVQTIEMQQSRQFYDNPVVNAQQQPVMNAAAPAA